MADIANYSRTITWDYNCDFILSNLSTSQLLPFLITCFTICILSIIFMSLKKLKNKIEQTTFRQKNYSKLVLSINEDMREENRECLARKEALIKKFIVPYIYSILNSFLQVLIILFIVTMNGFVILSVFLGLTFGAYLFRSKNHAKSRKVILSKI